MARCRRAAGLSGDVCLEVEHILGLMLDKAKKAQIPCNTLLLAYTNVKAFETETGRRPLAVICFSSFRKLLLSEII